MAFNNGITIEFGTLVTSGSVGAKSWKYLSWALPIALNSVYIANTVSNSAIFSPAITDIQTTYVTGAYKNTNTNNADGGLTRAWFIVIGC